MALQLLGVGQNLQIAFGPFLLGRCEFHRLDLLVIGERHFRKKGFGFLEQLTYRGTLVGHGEDDAFQLIDKRAHDGGYCSCGGCESRVVYLVQVHDGDGINVPGAVRCQERRPQCVVGFGFGSEVADPRLQVGQECLPVGVGEEDASEIGIDKVDAEGLVGADQLLGDGAFQEGFVEVSSVFIGLIVGGA